MPNPAPDPLELAFLQESREVLPHLPPLLLEIGPMEAWVLLSQLQLASRHPSNRGASRLVARRIAKALQSYVAPPGTARGEVAERGWHPEYDGEAAHRSAARTDVPTEPRG